MHKKCLVGPCAGKSMFSRKSLHIAITGVLFLVLFASLAVARESYVRYPVLSSGYSSIKVFDRERRYVGRIPAENRYWAPIDRIPAFLQKAVVAIEDTRFYGHGGIDVRGIARALVKDVVKGKMVEGGSTITQQLIKNKYLSGEKTIDRKLKEAQLAMEYERRYTKKQILEMYLNEIYYGNGAYGIVQAARLYFDKNPEQLTDAECSLLAGAPKNPSRYNPLGPPADVGARRGLVLRRMQELGIISRQQERTLRNQRVTVIKSGQASSYVAHIRNKLKEQYGEGIFEQGGLDVIAALDLRMQKSAEKTLKEGVKRISPELQGALLSLDTASGDVLAAVGGVDSGRNSYNRAFYARRQPGSAIKPFIYAAALEKGHTAASFFNDSPVTYPGGHNGIWQPRNYGNEVFGEISLRKALAYSNNVITVKLLEAIGVSYFTEFTDNLGLPMRGRNDLTLALGTEEVTLSDLVAAYAPFANGGFRAKPRTIIRIYDRYRRAWTENPPSVVPVLSPATAFVTTQMLKDVLVYGTAKNLKKFNQERPSAGKTGTTDDYRDAWFIGYTPQVVTGVWVGHDKPRPGGRGFTGGAAAAPLWGQFMRSALAGKPAEDFHKPETVVSVRVDPSAGYLATPGCPQQRDEYFVSGTEPTEYCPSHGGPVIPPVEAGETVEPGDSVRPGTTDDIGGTFPE